MADVTSIRFQRCGRAYDFEANGIEVKRDDRVVVESDLGLSVGRVVREARVIETPKKPLKPVLRKATEEDLQREKSNETFVSEAREFFLERTMARGLLMKLVCTDVTLDRKRIIFYFVADGRIDFRELVKDLAAKFKMRIELRQIGVRDEAKITGGLGICGLELCCRRFLTSFEPISIKMAKRQDLALNTAKLSGVCGRLMCCLNYECGPDGYEPPVKVTPPAAAADSPSASPSPLPERDKASRVDRRATQAPRRRTARPGKSEASPKEQQKAAPRDKKEAAPMADKQEAGAAKTTQGETKPSDKKRRKRRWRKPRKKASTSPPQSTT